MIELNETNHEHYAYIYIEFIFIVKFWLKKKWLKRKWFIKILILDSTEPSTLMGQFMEALNSQTSLDDFNLNIDSFQGGLECNVDEVSAFVAHILTCTLFIVPFVTYWSLITCRHLFIINHFRFFRSYNELIDFLFLFLNFFFVRSLPIQIRWSNKNWISMVYWILIYHYQINTLDLIQIPHKIQYMVKLMAIHHQICTMFKRQRNQLVLIHDRGYTNKYWHYGYSKSVRLLNLYICDMYRNGDKNTYVRYTLYWTRRIQL